MERSEEGPRVRRSQGARVRPEGPRVRGTQGPRVRPEGPLRSGPGPKVAFGAWGLGPKFSPSYFIQNPPDRTLGPQDPKDGPSDLGSLGPWDLRHPDHKHR